MNLRNHFFEYYNLARQIAEERYELESIENRLKGLKSTSYGSLHYAHVDNRLSLIAKKDKILDKIADMEQRLETLREYHEQEIATLPSTNYQTVIRCYYLKDMTFGEIAELMGFSESHVKRLHREASEVFPKDDTK